MSVALICSGLRRTDDRETIADALTRVAALPCSPEGLKKRASVAAGGGLESITTALLTVHGDVRLRCKAASALASLCMSDEVATAFATLPDGSAVVDRLGDMLRSRSQWAQADAAGCLGWLVGHIQGAALHELLPLATRLMVKHTTTDDEVFIREEERQRHKQDREKWGGRNRGGSSKSGGGSSGGGGGGGGSKSFGGSGAADEEQARERMDNIRVYTLIFLLKASHADPSAVATMVEAGAIPGLLRHLSSCGRELASSQPPRQEREGQAEADPSSPSLLLAARLLYMFSLDPGARASLLETKALPPLIRLRRRLESATAGVAADTTAAAAAAVAPEPERARRTGSDITPSGPAGKGGGTAMEGGAGSERVDGEGGQPPLRDMIGLIVDQMVGRASSATTARYTN